MCIDANGVCKSCGRQYDDLSEYSSCPESDCPSNNEEIQNCVAPGNILFLVVGCTSTLPHGTNGPVNQSATHIVEASSVSAASELFKSRISADYKGKDSFIPWVSSCTPLATAIEERVK